ncbi:LSU ribosomal protein L15P [Armatimonadetes bacterium GBS]|jgi:large subunit ribosomal protein L15|nr:50S ribosomal protein L15 [bacterium HR14]GIV12862.1 MAG: 50S ribosomal protein L15 [Fimbriimonadales bacterium]CUU11072.1 LSU ribosomal protein L15P [Armatimonadetes bacterium GBS]CUU37660.1 LSU ribosomal protein L15P [Armatimonadetes bacterium DC]CUU37696.1 LSU ribosomal protein L15P [Armatimonadetes bacterium GXS]
MIELHTLKPQPGSKKRRKRVGRGIGSGHGKTATRGTKGQKARDTIPPRFEGGQTPIHRRLPVRVGFKNVNRVEYAIVNVGTLAQRFQPNDTVTPEILKERRIVRKLKDGVKILGEGEITFPLTVHAHAISESARAKIEAAGGTVVLIENA